MRFGWTPTDIEAMYLWQFQGALGLDRPPTPEQVKAQDAEKARQAMAARAERLKNLDEDTALERQARIQSRARRRERQRSSPEWKEEVKANRRIKREPDPSRVIQGVLEDGDFLTVK